MKYIIPIILFLGFLITPAFAQEEVEKEERQVEIRMESLGGGVEVGAASGTATVSIAAFPDKSVWHFFSGGNKTYCWVDDDNEPHCKEVKSE